MTLVLFCSKALSVCVYVKDRKNAVIMFKAWINVMHHILFYNSVLRPICILRQWEEVVVILPVCFKASKRV